MNVEKFKSFLLDTVVSFGRADVSTFGFGEWHWSWWRLVEFGRGRTPMRLIFHKLRQYSIAIILCGRMQTLQNACNPISHFGGYSCSRWLFITLHFTCIFCELYSWNMHEHERIWAVHTCKHILRHSTKNHRLRRINQKVCTVVSCTLHSAHTRAI